MKIPALLVLCSILMASVSPAQLLETEGGLGVGAAFEISIPAKSFADKVATGYGGSARFQYVPYKNIALVIGAGYIAWTDKGDPGFTSKANAFEFMAGPKFGFGSGVYGALEVGIYLVKEEFSVTGSSVAQPLEREKTAVMAGVVLGYEFSGVDVGLKYYPFDEQYTNAMLSVGYWFDL
jgi:hypothetical protein